MCTIQIFDRQVDIFMEMVNFCNQTKSRTWPTHLQTDPAVGTHTAGYNYPLLYRENFKIASYLTIVSVREGLELSIKK